MVESELTIKQKIKEDVKLFKKAIEGHNYYEVTFYFEYSRNGKNDIEQFGYASSGTDSETQKSMIERFIRTFENNDEEEVQEFDILKNNPDTIYYLNKKRFKNSQILIDNLLYNNISPDEDLTTILESMKKLKNFKNKESKTYKKNENSLKSRRDGYYKKVISHVKGAIIKIKIEIEPNKIETYYLFVNVNNFNAFKKQKLSLGIFGNFSKDGIKEINDKNTTFGIKDKISFYYHNGNYIIKNNSDFEKMLFLTDEYTQIAKKNVDKLVNNLSKVFINISQLKSDLSGAGKLNRMVARISINEINTKFNNKNKKTTFKKINDIIKKAKFREEFSQLSIDFDECTIQYETNKKFPFCALLSDRPSKTLLLEKEFME